MTYIAAPDRYERTPYRRCGRSGIQLPEVSLGLWHNFGDDRPIDTQRAIIRRAFDLGITHFDLANNYGPPYGSAEINFGRILREDLRPYRDELIISTKAGYDMWPGPYGEWGSRKYLLASLDQSLHRMGLDYVDIFYSHRFDPKTPLQETLGALDTAVGSGKALYAGISSYSAERTAEAAGIMRRLGTPILIHQPSYSMLNRWIEDGLLDVLGQEGIGCIAFSPLAQGVLTGKYLDGIPAGSRASQGTSLDADQLTEPTLRHVRTLADIARARGQSLAQLALSWALRDQRVTSVLIGASSVAQLEENVAAAGRSVFTEDELHGDRPGRRGRGHQHLGRVQRRVRGFWPGWAAPEGATRQGIVTCRPTVSIFARSTWPTPARCTGSSATRGTRRTSQEVTWKGPRTPERGSSASAPAGTAAVSATGRPGCGRPDQWSGLEGPSAARTSGISSTSSTGITGETATPRNWPGPPSGRRPRSIRTCRWSPGYVRATSPRRPWPGTSACGTTACGRRATGRASRCTTGPIANRLPARARADRPYVGGAARRRSAPRTTSGSVVAQNGGRDARRKLPYRLVTSRGSRIATTPRSLIVRSSRPVP